MNFKHIFVIGDIHGQWGDLDFELSKLPLNSAIILLGDIALGFSHYSLAEFERITHKILNEKNLTLFIIRGNHDSPYIWNEIPKNNKIKLIKDFTELTINNKNFYFVGGAISLDRTYRTIGVNYWADEKIDYSKYNKPINKIDILITHSAPSLCYPVGFNEFCEGWFKVDKALKEEVIQERCFLDKILEDLQPEQHYYGHFHQSYVKEINNCKHFLLSELEVREIF